MRGLYKTCRVNAIDFRQKSRLKDVCPGQSCFLGPTHRPMTSEPRQGPTSPRPRLTCKAGWEMLGFLRTVPWPGRARPQGAPYLLSSSPRYRSRLPPKYFFCELRASTWAAQVPCFSHSCFLGERFNKQSPVKSHETDSQRRVHT